MDKQKQIEEIARIILVNCGECYTCKYKDELHCADLLSAEELYNAGYRKIPENAVVLMEGKDLIQFEWSKIIDKMGIFGFADKIRKETAEKFAERMKGIFKYEAHQQWIDEIAKEIIGERE